MRALIVSVLVMGLGSDDFQVRERSQELLQIMARAQDDLVLYLPRYHADPEVWHRLSAVREVCYRFPDNNLAGLWRFHGTGIRSVEQELAYRFHRNGIVQIVRFHNENEQVVNTLVWKQSGGLLCLYWNKKRYETYDRSANGDYVLQGRDLIMRKIAP